MQKWTDRIFGIALGNTMVAYDFILYGFLGSTLSRLFFPEQTSFVALMSVFLVFASACLVRPFGAFLFGLIGDKFGRKASLVSSIILMSGSSLLIGCLPTYQHIGELSVFLLVLLRVVQGLSLSGEEVGSAVYLVESAPNTRKSIAGSIVLASVHIGLFFAAIMVWASFTMVSAANFLIWGWRIPFLLSLPIAMLVLYYRLTQSDSGAFAAIKHDKAFIYPLKKVFSQYKLRLLAGTLICGLSSIAIYLYAVYIPNYLKSYHHFATGHILLFNMLCFLLSAAAVLWMGYQGDRLGLIKPMKLAAVAYIILSPIAFMLLAAHSVVDVVIAQLLFIVIVALSSGTLMTLLNVLFPIEVRFTGVATCFNFSMMIFGSTAPIIILGLSKVSHSAVFPAVYMMLMGALVFVVLCGISRGRAKAEKKAQHPGLDISLQQAHEFVEE